MNNLIELLNQVSAGTVLKWVLVILTILSGLIAFSIRCYKWIESYRLRKNQLEENDRLLDQHNSTISEIKKQIGELVDYNADMTKINRIQTRHSIVRACMEALNRDCIDKYELQSLEDMFTLYTDVLQGNSYVLTLMKKVRHLRVISHEDDTDE
ncbi:hypothetical protein [Anaerolentibacter hominis]|uniref:hypothetical protein n=1 Tax=Anaerolentibacter hominis TaxID=3079009 RepID=UPI0031B8847B